MPIDQLFYNVYIAQTTNEQLDTESYLDSSLSIVSCVAIPRTDFGPIDPCGGKPFRFSALNGASDCKEKYNGHLTGGLFGGVQATLNDWITEIQLTRENQGLLAYLLLQRHKLHSRETLAEMFWGEQSQRKARGSLNTALWKLKKVIELEGIATGTYLKNSHTGEGGSTETVRIG